jgi:ribonuclease VapC
VSEGPHIFDASALLAMLSGEVGAAALPAGALPVMSAVNLLEVSNVLVRRGLAPAQARAILDELAVEVVPFEGEMIERATTIHAAARDRGLSLGDAVCLATAQDQGGTAWTADRAWQGLEVGVPVRMIR